MFFLTNRCITAFLHIRHNEQNKIPSSLISLYNVDMAKVHQKIKLSSFQIILGSFLLIILVGTGLLCLPFATESGHSPQFLEALFTATSATCVTGLIVQDTATFWSGFGQIVIIVLIQIGGMGVVTMAMALAVISGKKISLFERSIMQDSISADQVGGILKLTRFIILGSLMFELLGAVLLLPVFLKTYAFTPALGHSMFHAISAFCNAGFDLMGDVEKYSSFTAYAGNIHLNTVVILLIVIGGIGFRTWDDIRTNKTNFRRYRLQSKLILCTSLILIVLPAVYFFCAEFSELPFKDRILYSLFQSVTTRTAGFNTADQNTLSGAGLILTIMLMLIGGSPGSTAGGMKTTTFAILSLSALSVFRHHDDATIFGRRIPAETVRNATAIFVLYFELFLGAACIISRIEGIPILTCMYETASAIGTVGMTMGITPQLGTVSRCIIIFLMIFGRVGGLTMIYATLPSSRKFASKLPQESVNVG